MIKPIALAVILIVMVFSCIRLVGLERTKVDLKRDRVELSHIKYGLFSVDEWKRIIAKIITKKIQEFKITKASRPKMKQQVEEVLGKLLDEVEKVMKKQNGSRGIKGWVRGSFMDIFDVMADVRKGIPEYADMLLNYLEDPTNKTALQKNLIQRFNEMADKTVGEVDYTEYDAILVKYGTTEPTECLQRIGERTEQIQGHEQLLFILLAAACIALLMLILWGGTYGTAELLTMAACATALLVTGLALPMIDIEATIASFSFKLVGEPVEFTDQVLFFQSKSILQVVRLLITNGGFGLVLVALLVFTFSVLIPFAKLLASILTIQSGRPPANKLHRFLVFKSGKWSMADVMVVAIFMSYIGFNGVINSQLTQITAFSSNVQVFTTNNSVLQTGFYLFTGYCIIGLLLSAMIDKRMGERS